MKMLGRCEIWLLILLCVVTGVESRLSVCEFRDVKRELECIQKSTEFQSLPDLDQNSTDQILHILIRNQPNFRQLLREDLRRFRKLQTIYIEATGLELVEPYAFADLNELREVRLTRNQQYRNPNWISFTSSSTNFKLLDLTKNDFACDCDLEWLLNEDRNFEFRHPWNASYENLHISRRSLYKLPETIKPPDICVTATATTMDISEFLDRNCKSIPEPQLQLSIRDGYGNPSSFSEGDEALLKCSLKGSYKILNSSASPLYVTSLNSMNRGPQSKMEILYRNATAVVGLIRNLTVLDNAVITCKVGEGLLVPRSLADVQLLLVKGLPYIAKLHPITSASMKYCEYAVYSYPPASIEWLKSNHEPVQWSETIWSDSEKVEPSSRFFLQEGNLQAYNMLYHQDNYTMRACNQVGCSSKICQLWWNSYLPDPPQLPFRNSSGESKGSGGKHFPVAGSVGITIACVFFVIICVLLTAVWTYRKKVKKRYHRPGASSTVNSTTGQSTNIELLPLNSSLERNVSYLLHPLLASKVPVIEIERIRTLSKLGQGAFGCVYLAELKSVEEEEEGKREEGKQEEKRLVAAKCLEFHSSDTFANLVPEIVSLATLSHPNIVQFHGIAFSQVAQEIYLLFEYMEEGDLRAFLHKQNAQINPTGTATTTTTTIMTTPLSSKTLLNITIQIAEGLVYLDEKRIVHRDLAARNCLVAARNPILVKIADFGMSRDIYCADYYRATGTQLLPVRWSSPEAVIFGKFTSANDIWSFGVVMWEVYSFGKLPWFGYSNYEVMQKIQNKEKLTAPDDCPDSVYEVMLSCWTNETEQRPSAQEILLKLITVRDNDALYAEVEDIQSDAEVYAIPRFI